jgi:hypothetical protein
MARRRKNTKSISLSEAKSTLKAMERALSRYERELDDLGRPSAAPIGLVMWGRNTGDQSYLDKAIRIEQKRDVWDGKHPKEIEQLRAMESEIATYRKGIDAVENYSKTLREIEYLEKYKIPELEEELASELEELRIMLGDPNFNLKDLDEQMVKAEWYYDYDLDKEVQDIDPIDAKGNEVRSMVRLLANYEKEIAWRKRALLRYIQDMQSIGLSSSLVKSNPRKNPATGVLGALILGGIIGHSMKK